MNTSTVTTKISAVFLATVLIAGTLALSAPSFMTGAQAVPEYGMDRYDKKSSGKDVSVKSIKCNNINFNVNGLELNVLPPELSSTLASEAQASDEGQSGASSFGSGERSNGGGHSGSDNDFKFVCINNNNNEGAPQVPPVPPEEDPCVLCFEEFAGTDDLLDAILDLEPLDLVNIERLLGIDLDDLLDVR